MDGCGIEKNLCHVNAEASGLEAQTQCNSNGMQLYHVTSSDAALSSLVGFMSTLDIGSKPGLYIAGASDGNCQIVRKDGTVTSSTCSEPLGFFCEYFEPTHIRVPDVIGTWQSLAGVQSPKVAIYNTPVRVNSFVLKVSRDVDKYSIVELDVDDITGSEYLPINLGCSFPNLVNLYAESCSIKELRKENFQGFTKINFIDLDYNQITVISAEYFAGLSSLRRLDFGKHSKKI